MYYFILTLLKHAQDQSIVNKQIIFCVQYMMYCTEYCVQYMLYCTEYWV